MIQITEERNCCGCAACAAACPVGCITMAPGTLGAVFPQVDTEKCISCNKCEAVCPMLHAEEAKRPQSCNTVYAAYAKDPAIRNGGSSGGMFGTIAGHLLSKGHRIYGAGFDEELQLRCMHADTLAELAPLLKSKYLQSDLSEAYPLIKEDLHQGKQVLFVSTPCQVAALKRYLGKDYDNLLTVDFLCHGVPSQELFDKCKTYEEEKLGGKIRNFQFRAKIPHGATPHYFTRIFEKNGKVKTETKPYFRSVFYAFFQQYISLRESCYNCTFAEEQRVSDMTIADFHAIEKYVPDINRFQGVSTVMVHTEKGHTLWQEVQDKLWYQLFSLDQLKADRVLFAEKTQRPAGRDRFIKNYETLPFPAFVDRQISKKRYAIYSVYYALPKALRAIVKKLCHLE